MSGTQPSPDRPADGPTGAPEGMGDLWTRGAVPSRADIRRTTATLAAVAGFTDAVGFVVLFGLFIAHMSGNSTRFAVSIGLSDWGEALTHFFPIPMFVVGIAAGATAMEILGRRRFGPAIGLMLGVEAVLIAVFMVAGQVLAHERVLEPNSAGFFLIAGVAALAMGLQTAVLRKVGGITVHTTFISGMLTQVATSGVALGFARSASRRGDGGRTPAGEDPVVVASHLRFTGAIWLCYLAGGAAGAFLHSRWAFWALSVPLLALLGIVAYDLRVGLARPAR